ncbi:MAG: DUF6714 family protein, partial [Myxococcota bacterium]
AFVDVRPGAITLHEAEVLDDYGTEAERQRARRNDPETDWREVPDASIVACPTALSHLDPDGWRFYLPACMRYALRTWDRPHAPPAFSIDQVIYTLGPGCDPELRAHALARFERLDDAQRAVVVRFLELAASDDEAADAVVAREALDGYWRRPADAS